MVEQPTYSRDHETASIRKKKCDRHLKRGRDDGPHDLGEAVNSDRLEEAAGAETLGASEPAVPRVLDASERQRLHKKRRGK